MAAERQQPAERQQIAERQQTAERHREEGMTLVEIMIVVAIIGLFMSAVGVVAWRQWRLALVRNTERTIATVQHGLAQYGLEHRERRCPPDLHTLFKERILTKEPRDAWRRPLLWRCPAEHDVRVADVWSKGPDGQDGTDDDIRSWDLGSKPEADGDAE